MDPLKKTQGAPGWRSPARLALIAAMAQALASPLALAQSSTGSYGDFSPKAFLEAPAPWTVFRAVGKQSKTGFPCSTQGLGCSRDKSYNLFEVRPEMKARSGQYTGIHIGVGEVLGGVSRHEDGSFTRIELKTNNNLAFATIDSTRASSRLGITARQATTMTRNLGLHGGSEVVGHTEAKAGTWALINPVSYYYRPEREDSPKFGLTVVERMSAFNNLQNYNNGTPGKERIRDATFWCQSEQWQPTEGFFERLVKSDEFDVGACKTATLMESKTAPQFTEKAAAWFLNRQDSTIHARLSNGQVAHYYVQANTEWLCPFDCDGTTYRIRLGGKSGPVKVLISSNKWNWGSSSRFKAKVVMVDWDGSGFPAANIVNNHNLLVSDPAAYRKVVAVLISEMKDVRGDDSSGSWSQHTYVMLPPAQNLAGVIPQDKIGNPAQARYYQLKLLDAILAMMPDQTQSSPELRDVEEKLDELRLFYAMQKVYPSAKTEQLVYADTLFDIDSEVDATTTPTWQSPDNSAVHVGKVEWLLNVLNGTR